MPGTLRVAPPGVVRHSRLDVVLVAASMAHAALLVLLPSAPVVALGMWWNANTVAHNFIHRPFFRRASHNRAYGLLLSAILGFPQSLWRERHLAHHAERPVRWRGSRAIAVEVLVVSGVWAAWFGLSPGTFLFAYVPGWIGGLVLCGVHGHFEHARGTTSHYGRLYNLLFFNDGYHVEHHLAPWRHWSALSRARAQGRASRWPAIVRWIELISLEGLERLVIAVPVLQRLVLHTHERAFRRLLPALARVRTVLVVGGGLFPRTALVLGGLLPEARLTIVDLDAGHLRIAGRFLDGRVECRAARFTGVEPQSVDLVVVPLSYVGDRRRLYEHPPAPLMLVHDWLWHWRPHGAAMVPLLKCVNVVRRDRPAAGTALIG